MRMWYDSLRRIPLIGFFLQMGEWLGHAEGASPSLMVASGEAPSEVYGHGGPGVCLGDGQTKAEEELWTRRHAFPAYASIRDLEIVSFALAFRIMMCLSMNCIFPSCSSVAALA